MSKYLVITGGSRGIGEQTAAVYLQQGWKVINLSRSQCANAAVTNIQIDLTHPDSVRQQAGELLNAVKDAEQISLVHNAALFKRDDMATLEDDSLREVLQLNVVAASSLNTLFLPKMKPGSSIIYIGSTLSEIGVPNRASYVITKHAVAGMMRATCQDLAGKGISTCCICPGFVNTKMLTDAVDAPILQQIVKSKVTQERLIEPLEIAELIYFCATHPVVNGEVIHANLGQKTT